MPQKPDKFVPALYGGIVMGVISAIPFLNYVNCLCCAGYLLGGFLGVYFYQKALTKEMDVMTSSNAMGVGALSGLFGAIVSSILSGLLLLAIGNSISETILQRMRLSGAFEQMPPDQAALVEQVLSNPGILLFIGVVSAFIISPLFGLLGGLIGYGVFRKREGKDQQAV